ncbi:MAG: alpha-amylase, partial [Bacteroidaceae bacterium]|nr:alpha-amylase [Bacteroidaceae bacterium]
SIYRWRNGGKFNEDKLTANEKKVRAFYTRLLSIIRTEKAISDGQFFDVMYVNQGSWTFNDYKHYCFLRKYENELLVIVANFDGMKAKMGVNLPMHAFDYLNLPKDLGKVTATDLLTGKEEKLSIVPDHLTNITVDAYNGKILKITF